MRRMVLAVLVFSAGAEAAPITYTDIARDPQSGITYRRQESVTDGAYDAVKTRPFMSLEELFNSPQRPQGNPGIAIFDYDEDGDLDIYVTNGPGRANSLYKSLLEQTGKLKFVDAGAAAGVGATDMDSTGVCYGDTDNDGDQDLLVLGRMEPNRFFRNKGNGTFEDASSSSGLGSTVLGHTSCSMGDIDNDGLLDVYVANTFDWNSLQAIFNNLFSYSQPNQLYRNTGNNTFQDVSASSGSLVLHNVPKGDGSITHATALVDYDQDGDVDIFLADDIGAMPTSGFAGVDRGLLQLLKNDGAGNFTNVTAASGSLNFGSSWMGLSYGDYNCDGNLDLFGTNTGDYFIPQMGFPKPPGLDSSRWHLALGGGSGVFTTPEQLPAGMHATVFGWGTGSADYDNDGDTDIIYYGNINAIAFVSADNPGVIIRNEGCTAQPTFSWDESATAATADLVRRSTVDGLALGDLNDDGYVDMVWAAGMYVPESIPLVRMNNQFGSVFDSSAKYLPTFFHIGPLEWEWAGRETEQGFMGVQISSASTGNRWVKITTQGSKGLATNGKVNRDGIGALLKLTPKGGKSVLMPVHSGGSYSSQHALTQGFGLGKAKSATLEVLWPGGARNRLYDVKAGERITMPEIPCSFAAKWPSKNAYKTCVTTSLNQLASAGAVSFWFKKRLYDSAMKAYAAAH